MFDYGSSEDEEDDQPPPSALKLDEPSVMKESSKFHLPNAMDILNGNKPISQVSIAPLKRPALESTSLNIGTSSHKVAKISVYASPHLDKKSSSVQSTQLDSAGTKTPVTSFIPPQLKRPNKVTEDSGLWNSGK